MEWLEKLAYENNGKCLSKFYINTNTKYEWMCDKNHRWRALPRPIHKGSWCPICHGRPIVTITTLQNIALERGGICLSNEYINSSTQYDWKCLKNHVWSAVYESIQQGSWCPRCRSSHGEKKINKWAEKTQIKHHRQYKFHNCKVIKKLSFDFYFPNYNICIEYDGEQHFNNRWKWNSKEKTQKYDMIKNDFCNKNNIKLIRIPYTKFNEIESILDSEYQRGFDRSLNLSAELLNNG